MDLSEKQKRADAVQARLHRRPVPRWGWSQVRLIRTVGLGAVAVAFGLYWLADAYGVGMAELAQVFVFSLGFVAAFVALAAFGGGVLVVAKGRWFQDRSAKKRSMRGR